MKDVQTLIGQLVSNADKGMPSRQEGRPKEQYNALTLKLVILAFTRLGDLFDSKARAKGLVVFETDIDEEKENYSPAIILWHKKLLDLTVDNFKTGIAGLEKRAEESYRAGGEMWPPSYSEFRALCFGAGKDRIQPMESCFAELTSFISANRKDTHNLSHILYHTIRKNMDFYNYKKIEKDWDRIKSFEIAYKATLFQLESGEQLMKIPNPETLIEKSSVVENSNSPECEKAATETVSSILSMFSEEPKQPTAEEIADNERLEKIRGGV